MLISKAPKDILDHWNIKIFILQNVSSRNTKKDESTVTVQVTKIILLASYFQTKDTPGTIIWKFKLHKLTQMSNKQWRGHARENAE